MKMYQSRWKRRLEIGIVVSDALFTGHKLATVSVQAFHFILLSATYCMYCTSKYVQWAQPVVKLHPINGDCGSKKYISNGKKLNINFKWQKSKAQDGL
jgi:hypothetical protein